MILLGAQASRMAKGGRTPRPPEYDQALIEWIKREWPVGDGLSAQTSFILPDGHAMGRRHTSPTHWSIALHFLPEPSESSEWSPQEENRACYEFMRRTGAVRHVNDSELSVAVAGPMSPAQVQMYVREARRVRVPLNVDVYDAKGNAVPRSFPRPTVDEVQAHIARFTRPPRSRVKRGLAKSREKRRDARRPATPARVSIYEAYGGAPEPGDKLDGLGLGLSEMNRPLPVTVIPPERIARLRAMSGQPLLQAFRGAKRWQQRLVAHYRRTAPSAPRDVVILDGNHLVDGHHRAMAAYRARRPLRVINLADLDKGLTKAKGFIEPDGREHTVTQVPTRYGLEWEDHEMLARRILGVRDEGINTMRRRGAIRFWENDDELALEFRHDAHPDTVKQATAYLTRNYRRGQRVYLDIPGVTGAGGSAPAIHAGSGSAVAVLRRLKKSNEPRTSPGAVAFDLDGTLARYAGDPTHIGPPIPGMREVVQALVERRQPVVVFTARTDTQAVRTWLARYGFPLVPVTNEKSPALATFVDDRAIGFAPAMVDTPQKQRAFLDLVLRFKPYWAQGKSLRVVSQRAAGIYLAKAGATDGPRGECQICGRSIGVKTGKIAHHGYTRRYGWQTASCAGARCGPYETTREAIPHEITRLTKWVADTKALDAREWANPPETIEVVSLTRGAPTKVHARPEGFDPTTLSEHQASMPGYAGNFLRRRRDRAAHIKAAESEIGRLQQRHDAWTPKTIAQVETAQREVQAREAAVKTQRSADRAAARAAKQTTWLHPEGRRLSFRGPSGVSIDATSVIGGHREVKRALTEATDLETRAARPDTTPEYRAHWTKLAGDYRTIARQMAEHVAHRADVSVDDVLAGKPLPKPTTKSKSTRRGTVPPQTSAFRMPVTGTTAGDPTLPLYRFVGGTALNRKHLGMHWTHDRHEVEQMATWEPGFILTADHPGVEHVMDWENPADRDVMEREIGSYKYRDSVFPEVPIRPGAPIVLRRVEEVGKSTRGVWLAKAGGMADTFGFYTPAGVITSNTEPNDSSHESIASRRDLGKSQRGLWLTKARRVSVSPAGTVRGVPRSRAFKHWFKGSKVVHPHGAPLPVHHRGSFEPREDRHVSIGDEGMHFGTREAADARSGTAPVDHFIRDARVEQDEDGRWHWDASDGSGSYDLGHEEGFETEDDARGHLERTAQDYSDYGDGPEIPRTTAYLAIKNPQRVRDQGASWAAAVKRAKAAGHDGLVYRNAYEDKGKDSWVAFYPRQVKLVTSRSWRHPSDVMKSTRTLYHGTTAQHAKRLLRRGFDRVDYPFLTEDLAEARRYAQTSQAKTPGIEPVPAILEVEVDPAHLEEGDRPGEWGYRRAIPSRAVRLRKSYNGGLWLRKAAGDPLQHPREAYANWEALPKDASWDHPAYQETRAREKAWDRAARVAISEGRLHPDRALTLGYSPTGDESGGGKLGDPRHGWKPLPRTLYHVTTSRTAVLREGLKTRTELGQQRGAGLGGGDADTVSFTTSPTVARTIARTLHEARRVVTGEYGLDQMIANARRAGFLQHWMRQHGNSKWVEGDPYPHEIEEARRGVRIGHLGAFASSEFTTAMEPSRARREQRLHAHVMGLGKKYGRNVELMAQDEPSEARHAEYKALHDALTPEERDQWSALSSTGGLLAHRFQAEDLPPGWKPVEASKDVLGGITRYAEAERPLTESEQHEARIRAYKGFISVREQHGGMENPVLFLSDPSALARTKPEDVGVLRARPKRGAMGYRVGGLEEWRTASGRAVDVEDVHPPRVNKSAGLWLAKARRARPPQVIPDDIKARTYYHATDDETKGQQIVADGQIAPPPGERQSRALQAPVLGHVYISPSKENAVVYGLGGLFAGHTHQRQRGGRYGYIFEIEGRDFTRVQPDEDVVGELLSHALQGRTEYTHAHGNFGTAEMHGKPIPSAVRSAVGLFYRGAKRLSVVGYDKNRREVHPDYRRVKDGEAAYWSKWGKRAVGHMTDAQKFDVIRMGAHVAHHGPLPIRRAWRLDKQRSKDLAPDGSNLFEIAEEVPVPARVQKSTAFFVGGPKVWISPEGRHYPVRDHNEITRLGVGIRGFEDALAHGWVRGERGLYDVMVEFHDHHEGARQHAADYIRRHFSGERRAVYIDRTVGTRVVSSRRHETLESALAHVAQGPVTDPEAHTPVGKSRVVLKAIVRNPTSVDFQPEEPSDGVSYGTTIVHGSIPAKYLKVVHEKSRRRSALMFKARPSWRLVLKALPAAAFNETPEGWRRFIVTAHGRMHGETRNDYTHADLVRRHAARGQHALNAAEYLDAFHDQGGVTGHLGYEAGRHTMGLALRADSALGRWNAAHVVKKLARPDTTIALDLFEADGRAAHSGYHRKADALRVLFEHRRVMEPA